MGRKPGFSDQWRGRPVGRGGVKVGCLRVQFVYGEVMEEGGYFYLLQHPRATLQAYFAPGAVRNADEQSGHR